MMLQRFQEIIALSCLLMAAASAFSSPKSNHLVRRLSPALNVGAVWLEENDQPDSIQFNIKADELSLQEVLAEEVEVTESSAVLMFHLLSRAKAYTNSESCNLDEVQSCLDDLLIQKEILAPSLASDKADTVEEVVANLQQKIDAERTQLAFARAPIQVASALVSMSVVYGITIGLWLLSPLQDVVDRHGLFIGHLGFNRDRNGLVKPGHLAILLKLFN